MKDPLVIECTEQMAKLLDALQASGMFGPSRETCAQRILELKLFELSMWISRGRNVNT